VQEPAAADHDVCTEERDSEEEMVEEELEEAAATLEAEEKQGRSPARPFTDPTSSPVM
jgi:hypothetical protein